MKKELSSSFFFRSEAESFVGHRRGHYWRVACHRKRANFVAAAR